MNQCTEAKTKENFRDTYSSKVRERSWERKKCGSPTRIHTHEVRHEMRTVICKFSFAYFVALRSVKYVLCSVCPRRSRLPLKSETQYLEATLSVPSYFIHSSLETFCDLSASPSGLAAFIRCCIICVLVYEQTVIVERTGIYRGSLSRAKPRIIAQYRILQGASLSPTQAPTIPGP